MPGEGSEHNVHHRLAHRGLPVDIPSSRPCRDPRPAGNCHRVGRRPRRQRRRRPGHHGGSGRPSQSLPRAESLSIHFEPQNHAAGEELYDDRAAFTFRPGTVRSAAAAPARALVTTHRGVKAFDFRGAGHTRPTGRPQRWHRRRRALRRREWQERRRLSEFVRQRACVVGHFNHDEAVDLAPSLSRGPRRALRPAPTTAPGQAPCSWVLS